MNSVAGRILREFAIDAGLSPDLRELDDDAQKRAFAAALDTTAARAGITHADLLARTEHDGDPDDDGYGTAVSWLSAVERAATIARTNAIPAAQVRAAVAESWESYVAAAELPAPDSRDRRGAWLAALGRAVDDLRTALDDGVYTTADGATAKIGSGSMGKTEKSAEDLRRLHRTLSRRETAPWSAWAKLAAIAADAGENAKGGIKPKSTYGAVADHVLFPLASTLVEELPAHPQLQDDIRSLLELVLTTAADSLDAYAAHKRALGLIDFVDQEVLALELLRSNPRVRAAVGARYRLLAVDEFQDTSPVQLAVFLELSRLIEDKIWVGDPKQAIYGFRDADPALMRGIIDALEAGGTVFGTGTVRNLEHSWRSSRAVIGLANALFTEVFADAAGADGGPDRVSLSVPDPRREAALDGRVEAWTATGPGRASAKNHTAALADGVARMVAEGTDPGAIAVLTRTNSAAEAVGAALADRGVPASGADRPMLSTREGQILRAALACTLDSTDSLALTELVSLLPDHTAHATWFADLAAQPDRVANRALLAQWWEDPSLAGLRAVRRSCIGLTPVEMIDVLIDATDLSERVLGWSDPAARLATLDAVRHLAVTYADEARSAGEPVTLSGLRTALDSADDGADLSDRPGAVWVGTVHAAKGLEWENVVVMLPGISTRTKGEGGVRVRPAPVLDVADPLAGRGLHYWPQVLGGLSSLQDSLKASPIAMARRESDREESARVQYVALTRARRSTILCAQPGTTVLDTLLPPEEGEATAPLVSWDAEQGTMMIAGRIATGASDSASAVGGSPSAGVRDVPGIDDLQPVVRTIHADPEAPVRVSRPAEESFIDVPMRAEPRTARAGARFQASGVTSDTTQTAQVRLAATLGPPLVEGGGRDWNRVGEAVHGYLALPLDALDDAQKHAAAARLCSRWGVDRAVGADAVVEAGARWHRYLAETFPGAAQLTEQPIAWWNDDAQAMEGWIDTLLRLGDGSLIVVDHKSYSGSDPAEHIRTSYLGQLDTYARALEAATGARPRGVLVHLPLRGEVWEVVS